MLGKYLSVSQLSRLNFKKNRLVIIINKNINVIIEDKE